MFEPLTALVLLALIVLAPAGVFLVFRPRLRRVAAERMTRDGRAGVVGLAVAAFAVVQLLAVAVAGVGAFSVAYPGILDLGLVKEGRVTLHSNPPATVWFHNKFLGRTPLTVWLPLGRHRLKVGGVSGYDALDTTIAIHDGEVYRLELRRSGQDGPATSQRTSPGVSTQPVRSTNITRSATASASSECRPSRKYGSTFYARNAIDGDRTTAWIEGKPGAGLGEWLELNFPNLVEVDSIRVLPGYDKYVADNMGDRWPMNFRVKRARLNLDGHTREVSFADRRGFQSIPVGGHRTRRIRLILLDVHTHGARDHDTAISEIEVWGRTL